MSMRFSPWIISASAIALAAASGAALAQSGSYDMSQPPIVHMQAVPPDRGTNDDTSGGRTFADQPFDVNGTEVVCTGTDSDSRHDRRWPSYPMRLEFAGADGQYLGEEAVTVTGNGIDVSVRCKGPWVLMKVGPGKYSVRAQAGGQSKTVSVNIGHGQTRTVITFPAAGGRVTAPLGDR